MMAFYFSNEVYANEVLKMFPDTFYYENNISRYRVCKTSFGIVIVLIGGHEKIEIASSLTLLLNSMDITKLLVVSTFKESALNQKIDQDKNLLFMPKIAVEIGINADINQPSISIHNNWNEEMKKILSEQKYQIQEVISWSCDDQHLLDNMSFLTNQKTYPIILDKDTYTCSYIARLFDVDLIMMKLLERDGLITEETAKEFVKSVCLLIMMNSVD